LMLRKTFFIAFPSLATHIDFVILSAAKDLLFLRGADHFVSSTTFFELSS
jgi:hypothetical protein